MDEPRRRTQTLEIWIKAKPTDRVLKAVDRMKRMDVMIMIMCMVMNKER